jgi:hypothetical protein
VPSVFSYILDGSETTSRMPGRLCTADSGATWTTSWDGQAIVIMMIGALPPNGKPIAMNVKSTLQMESDDTLRVETSAQGRTNSTVYKRTGPAAIPVSSTPVGKAQATIAQLEWLSGVWTGTAGSSTVEERWLPAAGGAMLATSRTIRDGLMNAFEFLCIVERDGGLVYQAMPNGRQPATDFTLTKIDADNAVFENPAHDFPKTIRYTRRPDGMMEAVISGAANQRPTTFVFKRQN